MKIYFSFDTHKILSTLIDLKNMETKSVRRHTQRSGGRQNAMAR